MSVVCKANFTLTVTLPLWAIAPGRPNARVVEVVEDGLIESVRALSRSQHAEELYAVENFFLRVRNGFFLEMGALKRILPSPQPPQDKRPPNDWFFNTRLKNNYAA